MSDAKSGYTEDVSIHVPARGTTEQYLIVNSLYNAFQSTFPRGERLSVIAYELGVSVFQSTFPRGERR